MKEKIVNFLNFIGQKEYQFRVACLLTGLIYSIFAFTSSMNGHTEVVNIFSNIAGVFLGIWLIFLKDAKTLTGIVIELFLLFGFIFSLLFSLNFCINSIFNLNSSQRIIYSILSSIGMFYCCFYLVSKFVDVYKFIKKALDKFKTILFNADEQNRTNRIQSILQNLTALLVAITSFAIAIKAIIEPVIEMFK